MGNIDNVLAFNRGFVASKGYEAHLTDKYPDKKLAVLSCMDTRLSGTPRCGASSWRCTNWA